MSDLTGGQTGGQTVGQTGGPMVNYLSRPSPDPTLLTTQQLEREIANTMRILDAKREGVAENLGNKIDAAEKNNAIRFAAIEKDFAAIEAWRREQKIDTKTAVDAALAAAEKAVRDQTIASEKSNAKTETSAAQQSQQQYATFKASLDGVSNTLADVKDRVGKMEPGWTSIKSIEDAVADIRDRVTRMESNKIGASESVTEHRGATSNLGAMVGIGLGLIGILTLIISFVVDAAPK